MQVTLTTNQESTKFKAEESREVFICLSFDFVVKDLNFPTGNILKIRHVYSSYLEAMTWLESNRSSKSRITTIANLPTPEEAAVVAHTAGGMGITLQIVRAIVI